MQKWLKIDLQHDPTMAFLGTYPQEMRSAYDKVTCNPMFIVAQSAIGNAWKTTQMPSKEEQVKKLY